MSEQVRGWIKAILVPVITVILFSIGNFIINPQRALADTVADHEVRISLEEQSSRIVAEELKEVNRKLDRLINMFMGER